MTGSKIKVTRMPGVKRAYRISGPPFRFSPDERRGLLSRLRRTGPKGEQFLSDIAWRVHTYLADRAIAKVAPMPTASDVRARIRQMHKTATRLHGLLSRADPAGEVSCLRQAQFALERRLGAPEALKKALEVFLPVAAAACEDPRPGGRQPNRAEYGLILGLTQNYLYHFGKLPPASRETSFGAFIGDLLKKLGVDGAGDRYRLIQRAVEEVRATSAPTNLLKTPSKKVRL